MELDKGLKNTKNQFKSKYHLKTNLAWISRIKNIENNTDIQTIINNKYSIRNKYYIESMIEIIYLLLLMNYLSVVHQKNLIP